MTREAGTAESEQENSMRYECAEPDKSVFMSYMKKFDIYPKNIGELLKDSAQLLLIWFTC